MFRLWFNEVFCENVFVMSKNMENILKLRRNETRDIVKRIGAITADRLHLANFPLGRPTVVFNATIFFDEDSFEVYARIIMGYYTYASAIVKFFIPLEELYEITQSHFTANILISPENKYDIWGTEDPRATEVRGKRIITYTGRTINFFDPHIRIERTLPIICIEENNIWRKIAVFKLRNVEIVSNKDAFLVDIEGLKLFHRPHTSGPKEEHFCAISEVPDDILEEKEFKEIELDTMKIVLEPAPFEEKIGWGTPPVKVDDEYLLLLHATDKEMRWYRVFAVLMDEKCNVTAVTPYYIMKPKENYERYGDRPLVVFPCGAAIIDDELIISYGAADTAIAFGEIDISELISILDKNRIS